MAGLRMTQGVVLQDEELPMDASLVGETP